MKYYAWGLLITAFLFAISFSVSATRAQSLDHLVISEVQISGSGGSNDEFIELYNPEDTAIDIHTWSIQRETTGGSFDKKNFVSPATIPAHGHYLIANNSYDGAVVADLLHNSFNLSLTGTTVFLVSNQVLLITGDESVIVDKVGIGSTALDSEGSPFVPIPGANVSIERKLGVDTDNNLTDFVLQVNPNPQNTNSQPESVTPSPSFSPSASLTPSPTETPTASPTPTSTPTESPSPTPTQVPTSTPSPTEEPTATPTPTSISTSTPAPSPTEEPVITPSPTAGPTSAPTPTEAPSLTPSPTPSPSTSPVVSPSPSPSPSPTSTPAGSHPMFSFLLLIQNMIKTLNKIIFLKFFELKIPT